MTEKLAIQLCKDWRRQMLLVAKAKTEEELHQVLAQMEVDPETLWIIPMKKNVIAVKTVRKANQ